MMKRSTKLTLFTSISAGALLSGPAYSDDGLMDREKSIVKNGDTLSKLAINHLGPAYKSGHVKVIDLYLSLNSHVLHMDQVYPGQTILHPSKAEIKENLGEWAFDKYMAMIEGKSRKTTIVKPGDSLTKIILSEYKMYFDVGRDPMIDAYLELNTDILSAQLIYPGDKVFHPTESELRARFSKGLFSKAFRIIASAQERADAKEEEFVEKIESKKESRSFLEFSLGNEFASINSENNSNGQSALLISDASPSIGLTLGHRKNKNEFSFDYNLKKIKYLDGDTVTIENSEFNIVKYGLRYTRLQNRFLRFGVEVNYGEDYFQKGVDATTLELFKIRSTALGLSYGAGLYETDDFNINLELKYFQQKLEVDSSTDSLDSGTEKYLGLGFEFPREWGSAGVKIYHQQNSKESELYTQEESFDGGMIFYNMDF